MEKLSYKSIFALMVLVSMLATMAAIPSGNAQSGPYIDVLRHEVIKSPDSQLIAMQTGQVDVIPDLIRTADIEKLYWEGNLITQDLGFNVGFIGYNIRDLASTERVPGAAGWKDTDIYNYRLMELQGAFWPLAHAEFRKALIRCYDQLDIIPRIYGYIVTPVRSLVPPAQSKYYNPGVQSYPYNPGNPFTSPAGEQSTVGILKAAGYTFVDAGTIGVVDGPDYWTAPGGIPLPEMKIWTPLIDVAPTSYQHCAEFIADLANVGLKATTQNGNHGLINEGKDFNEYLNLVYGTSTTVGGQFDAYMVFNSLGRLPDQLRDFMHSSSLTVEHPGGRNAAGIDDPEIDALCNIVQYSFDVDDVEDAAKEIQYRLYDTSYDYALAYMLLYSRSYFNAFAQNIDGVLKSPGYGSDNMWTWLSIHWEYAPRLEDVDFDGDQETVVISVIGDEPDSFNYNSATTEYEWSILGKTVDGLTAVNYQNHTDIPWIATNWEIMPTAEGMDVSFTIRNDVQWQDGYSFTAYDIEWCLEFLRDYEVPKYYTAWGNLIDVVVTDATHCTVRLSAAGLSLFYDVADVGALLAPQIWDRAWASNAEVQDWIPTGPYSPAPGYAPGPTPTPTNVMGTGPYIFQFYDTTNLYDDMWRNENYFMPQADIANFVALTFWQYMGDEDYNGYIDIFDITQISFAYGSWVGGKNYNPDANFNRDMRIDTRDLRIASYHLTWHKYYSYGTAP